MSAPLVMGIINVTPDSFSGDGLLHGDRYVEAALARAEQMVADGADILDIGGDSSRPGSVSVSTEEEIRRVIPVISAIKNKLGTATIAVDTVKADVAELSLREGASIVNDISALAGDTRMSKVIVNHNASVVLMHNRAKAENVSRDEKIGGQYDAPKYEDAVTDVAHDLKSSVALALEAGIAKNKIILDPGIGFGKTPEQNLALIAQLDIIKTLGFPVLVGPSRKSFIGRILDTSVDERLEGTAACVAVSVMKGADIIRVHDVKFMTRIIKMTAALKDAEAS
ncbi:MAG: dihydropteroate synthase [Bdellovibrionales bacterium]